MTDLIHQLSTTLYSQKNASAFCVSGKLASDDRKIGVGTTLSECSVIYEDKHGKYNKINFPAHEEAVASLVSSCDPATFGVLDVEKLDVSYRSAWKLDTTKFLSSFHPAETHIMEDIRSALFLVVRNFGDSPPQILAEPYKLNV